MSDLISKQEVIKSIDRFIPTDPMMSDYTQGISVGLAIATRCIEEFSQENHNSSQGLVKDLISRKDAIEAVDDIDWYHQNKNGEMVSGANPSDHQAWYKEEDIYNVLESLPSAEPERKLELHGDESAIEILSELRSWFSCFDEKEGLAYHALSLAIRAIKANSIVQAERKTGRWVKDNYGNTVCSECLGIRRDNRINYINFCNQCGADMRG